MVSVVSCSGVLQHRADRLDFVLVTMRRNDVHDDQDGRSSYAQKKADDCFWIVFACCTRQFCRSR